MWSDQKWSLLHLPEVLRLLQDICTNRENSSFSYVIHLILQFIPWPIPEQEVIANISISSTGSNDAFLKMQMLPIGFHQGFFWGEGKGIFVPTLLCTGNLSGTKRPFSVRYPYSFSKFSKLHLLLEQIEFPNCRRLPSLLPHSMLWAFLDKPSLVAWISPLDQEGSWRGEVQVSLRGFWLLVYSSGLNPSFDSARQGVNHTCQLVIWDRTNLLYTQKYLSSNLCSCSQKKKKSDICFQIIVATWKMWGLEIFWFGVLGVWWSAVLQLNNYCKKWCII